MNANSTLSPENGGFGTFLELAVQKVSRSGIDQNSMVPRLSMVSRKMGQLMSQDAEKRVFRPAGWTTAGFRICFALWSMGPLPSHRVASVTHMNRATLSAALKGISDNGLVTKEPSTEDQRSVILRLTPKGESFTQETYEAHLKVEREWFGALTETEQLALLMLMEKIIENAPGE